MNNSGWGTSSRNLALQKSTVELSKRKNNDLHGLEEDISLSGSPHSSELSRRNSADAIGKKDDFKLPELRNSMTLEPNDTFQNSI